MCGVCFLSSLSTANSTQAESEIKSSIGSFTPKSVKLLRSSKSDGFKIYTSDGNSVVLPRYEKIVTELPSLLSKNKIAAINYIPRPAILMSFAEKKEIEELSQKLGITIEDTENIDLFREIADWLGTRYRRGGMSDKGIDCSGFANVIYNRVFNKKIPRVSTVIAANVDQTVTKTDLQPGDLVFFSTFGKKHINHVGVYIGEGKFAHASCKYGVIVSTLSEGYYNRTWKKAGRLV